MEALSPVSFIGLFLSCILYNKTVNAKRKSELPEFVSQFLSVNALKWEGQLVSIRLVKEG